MAPFSMRYVSFVHMFVTYMARRFKAVVGMNDKRSILVADFVFISESFYCLHGPLNWALRGVEYVHNSRSCQRFNGRSAKQS